MKNYTCGWVIRDRGLVEVPETEYTERMWDMKGYIALLSNAVVAAKCGWDGVEYKAMRYADSNDIEVYMVLCVDGRRERWIPISGNSKGSNLSVLGENIW